MSIFVSSLFPLILAANPGPAPVAPVAVASPAAVSVKAAPAVITAPKIHGLTKGQEVVVDTVPDVELVRVQQTPSPAPAPAPAATAADRQAIIDRAGKALEAVKTAEGKFSQVDPGGASSSGAFYISRPGRVRFEYTAPEPMFIVSDGTTVSIEEPKRRSYDSVPLNQTPLHLFLRSNVDLKRDGSVKKVETVGGSHFVTLVDRSGEAPGEMVLEFRASDFELLGWRALDGAGETTQVRLSGVKTNVKLKPGLFTVTDPADRRDDRR